MKKLKSFLLRPAFLLSLSAVLLAFSALGSARAALEYQSEYYSAQMQVSSIGVTLMENGEKISYRDYKGQGDQWNKDSGTLLAHLLDDEEDGKLVPGKEYKEKLCVYNSGDIDTYVRVTIYKDWQNKNGVRDTSLSPDLIELGLGTSQGWVEDVQASTAERTVLYYTKVLPAKESTKDLCSTLKIDTAIAKKAKESVVEVDEKGYKTISTNFVYDGYRFNLTADVDAVQTHNAREAIKSAWGVDVDVAADGTLSLLQ